MVFGERLQELQWIWNCFHTVNHVDQFHGLMDHGITMIHWSTMVQPRPVAWSSPEIGMQPVPGLGLTTLEEKGDHRGPHRVPQWVMQWWRWPSDEG
jgi:hypothetical protein